jgi:hypothetical protein
MQQGLRQGPGSAAVTAGMLALEPVGLCVEEDGKVNPRDLDDPASGSTI